MHDRLSPFFFLTAAIILSGCQDQADVTEPKILRPVQVIELKQAQDHHTQKFSGKVYSQKTADIAFRVPGYIREVLVKPGDTVSKGQILAQLDTNDFDVSKKELQARLIEAKSAHTLANSELKRVQKAVSDDAISSVTLDRAKSGYERTKAAVEVVEQNLQKVNDSIKYATLKAPFSGTVATTRFNAFEQVQAGISVLTLHQPEKLEVRIDVPESSIYRFSHNLEGKVSWYGSEDIIKAYVSEIETQMDRIKQTYSVTYTLANKATDGLFSGKNVVVTSNFTDPKQNFCVPYSAITGKSNNSHVFVVKSEAQSNEVHLQPVQILYLKSNNACVSGELNVGDLVVVSGAHYLKDGMHVGTLSKRNREGV